MKQYDQTCLAFRRHILSLSFQLSVVFAPRIVMDVRNFLIAVLRLLISGKKFAILKKLASIKSKEETESLAFVECVKNMI